MQVVFEGSGFNLDKIIKKVSLKCLVFYSNLTTSYTKLLLVMSIQMNDTRVNDLKDLTY